MKIELNEIRNRCDNATGCIWIRKNGQILSPLASGDLLKIGGGFDINDAESVAHAREDIPILLEYITNLVSLMERAVEEIENCYGKETELTNEIRDVINI